MKCYNLNKESRTFMPEILSPGTGLSPSTNKSIVPTNNVFTIQDALDGRKSTLPGGGGNWSSGRGDDVSHSFKDPGDNYKREEMDLEHFRKITNPLNTQPEEIWKVKVPGGSKTFPSFTLVQQYRQKMQEKGVPIKWVARLAQNKPDKVQAVSSALKKTFKVESIDLYNNIKETGSAFCISANYFMTCAHVVIKYDKTLDIDLDYADYADRIKVVLIQGGRKISAEVVAIDTNWDIAILRADIDIEPFQLDVSSMQIGDDILTVGSPHGFENNVSFGNVSSIGKKIYSNPDAPRYFFVDAPVFQGNSGGPIIKIATGEVMGMLTAIVAKNGEYGLNVGLPSLYLQKFCIMNNIKTE